MKKTVAFLTLMLIIANVGNAQTCQPFTIQLNSQVISHPVFQFNELKVCLEDTLILGAIASFPNNNQGYEQTQANTSFIWSFEYLIPDTGVVIYKRFESAAVKNFNLRAVDVNGCYSTNQIYGKILISGNPIVEAPTVINAPVNSVIILNASEDQNATLVFQPVEIPIPPVPVNYFNNDTVFLPDGNGICYNDDLTILGFPNDQNLLGVQQIKSISINMEHTYLEDLSIRVTCPSGKTAVLKAHASGIPTGGTVANSCSSYGGGLNVGCPVDAPSHNLCYLEPGVGFDYEFRPGATGCFGSGGLTVESTFTDPCGTSWTLSSLRPSIPNSYTTTPSVPVYYGSYQDLSILVGCPLNGNWRITVCDHFAYDNGYVFKWGIQFHESLQTNPNPYVVGVDSVVWNGPNLTTIDPFSASVFHTNGGIFNYIASVYDHFGCPYDASFSINTTVGMEDFTNEYSMIQIYPNPTNGLLHISSEYETIKMVQLYSMNGTLLLEQNSDLLLTTIDLTHFQSGVYICKITSNAGEIKQVKVIKR